jgi:hypothetical protein
MSDLDPDASNGACYWRSGNRSEDVFIPCGNSAFGHVNCCQVGDKCLEHGACFNSKYGTTYLAGCTDPLYLDEACPDKRSYRGTTSSFGSCRCRGLIAAYRLSRLPMGWLDLLRP